MSVKSASGTPQRAVSPALQDAPSVATKSNSADGTGGGAKTKGAVAPQADSFKAAPDFNEFIPSVEKPPSVWAPRFDLNKFDGKMVGAPAKKGQPDSVEGRDGDRSTLKPYQPSPGKKKSNELVYYVNGMNTPPGKFSQQIREVADAVGSPMLGIYNATNGKTADITQCVANKLGHMDPAAKATSNLVFDTLVKNGKPTGKGIHLVGHSQGGIILSTALGDVKSRLEKLYQNDPKRDEKVGDLLDKVKVEVWGGAAMNFPDGPRYVHYVNDKDPIPGLFGMNGSLLVLDAPKHGGKDASYYRFSDKGEPYPGEGLTAGSAHKIAAYGKYRAQHRTFDEAYKNGGSSITSAKTLYTD